MTSENTNEADHADDATIIEVVEALDVVVTDDQTVLVETLEVVVTSSAEPVATVDDAVAADAPVPGASEPAADAWVESVAEAPVEAPAAPVENAETPVENAEAPVENTETPVEHAGVSAEHTAAPSESAPASAASSAGDAPTPEPDDFFTVIDGMHVVPGDAPATTEIPDAALLEAHDLALQALREITSAASIGAPAGHRVEPDGVVSLLFANTLLGYPGWFWTVSLARVPGEEPTVLEAELLPGETALLAPDWVPWAVRLAEYQAAQAAQAEAEAAAGVVADADDTDDADADIDMDDIDDLDAADFDEDGSPILHAGDVDGVDIDQLDPQQADDDDDDDLDDADDDDDELDDDDEDEDELDDDDDDDEDEDEEDEFGDARGVRLREI